MVSTLLNHIQGKNGSRWAKYVRDVGMDQLLLVAIDAAKFTHKAMICTFFGDVLVKPFEFDASISGYNLLKERVQQEKELHGFEEVVIGIETTGHYYEDLVYRCDQDDFCVRVINAATTAQERKTLLNRSKTDNLDLYAIVQSIINGRGTSSELSKGEIRRLQKLTRARRELVQERTETQNLIRVHIDHIFREFQGKSIWKKGKRYHVQPFSKLFGKAPCYLMRHHLHPSDILELGEDGLRELSIRENLKIRDQSIQTLLDFAKNSISQPKKEVDVDQFLLIQKLDRLELLDGQIKVLERKIEGFFIEMNGVVILTVPGIGLVTGAELYAEMGDISDFTHAGQLIKMAGTNPIVKQSGGNRPSYYGISKEGRRSFRNIVYQVGKSLAVNNPEMNKRYLGLKERGKHTRQAYIALGNQMIRLAFSMIRHQALYRTDQKNYMLLNELQKKLHSQSIKRFYERFVLPAVSSMG